MKAHRYWLAYLTPGLLLIGAVLGGLWLLLPTAAIFVVLPIVDGLFGDDMTEPTPGDRSRFDWALRLWLPMQVGLWGVIATWVAQGRYTLLELAALTVACGIVASGSGITVAHELMHRRSRLDRALAEGLMLCALYPWFCIEHVQGHHRHVSTPQDPAFSPRGQSLYRYLPQTLTGGLISAWRIETKRVQKRAIRGLADRRIRYSLQLAAVLGLSALAGPWVFVFVVGQALLAVTLLETINYVEHYGLHRRQRGNGKYERVSAAHSWNTPARVSNWYLFNLQRHADHHAFAARPYDQLRNLPGSPTLPAGYPTMVILAFVPPLWFRIMHPIIDALPHHADTQGIAAK